jgi:hypothetical protein
MDEQIKNQKHGLNVVIVLGSNSIRDIFKKLEIDAGVQLPAIEPAG